MLVIFEGNEGSGKTTLANMLAHHLHTSPMKMKSHIGWKEGQDMYPYPWHMNDAGVWTWRFLMEMLRPQIVNSDIHHISDRSFITQAVYHPVFGGEMNWFHKSAYEAMPKHLATIKHIVFHIDRNVTRECDEMMIEYKAKPEDFVRINESYNEYYQQNKEHFNLFRIDNNGRSISEVFNQILQIFETEEAKMFIK